MAHNSDKLFVFLSVGCEHVDETVLQGASAAKIERFAINAGCSSLQRSALRRIAEWWSGSLRCLIVTGIRAVDDTVLRFVAVAFSLSCFLFCCCK